MSDAIDTVVKVGVVAGAAYLAYEHLYLPWKVENDLKRQADWLQRQNPALPRKDALQLAAEQACQLYALGAGGIPPQLSQQACGLVGGIANGLIRNAPAIVAPLAKAQVAVLTLPVKVATTVLKETAKPFVSAGKDVAKFFSKLF